MPWPSSSKKKRKKNSPGLGKTLANFPECVIYFLSGASYFLLLCVNIPIHLRQGLVLPRKFITQPTTATSTTGARFCLTATEKVAFEDDFGWTLADTLCERRRVRSGCWRCMSKRVCQSTEEAGFVSCMNQLFLFFHHMLGSGRTVNCRIPE